MSRSMLGRQGAVCRAGDSKRLGREWRGRGQDMQPSPLTKAAAAEGGTATSVPGTPKLRTSQTFSLGYGHVDEAQLQKRFAGSEKASERQWGQAVCGGGLLLFFLIYGVLQERLMTQPYGEEEEMFTSSAFIVLVNRIVAVVGAAGLLLAQGKSLANAAPAWKSFGVGISNTMGTLCQWESLKYVSFPTQTLGKCGKTIPVLLLGTLLGHKRYTWHDYAICAAISVGCTVFVLTGDISTRKGATDTVFGLALVCLYLGLDGFTSVFQEMLFKGYKMSTHNQMLHVNLSSGIIIVALLLVRNELASSVAFCMRHPEFFAGSLCLASAAMLGQMMLYHTIKTYGALFFATVMTTRHIFSIALSCLIYLHPLSWAQVGGAAVVFAALYYKAVRKRPAASKVIKV